MKRKKLFRALWLIFSIALLGTVLTSMFIYSQSQQSNSNEVIGQQEVTTQGSSINEEPAPSIDTPTPPITPEDPITTKISNMTVEEKVGQMFIFGYTGVTPNPHILRAVSEYKIGGVMLLFYNLPDDQSTRANIAALQDHAASSGNLPLFISVDQEGGTVNAFRYWDSSMKRGQREINSEEQAFESSRSRSGAIMNLGVNINFAPTADYITNPKSFLYARAFKGAPEEVGGLAASVVKGADDVGVITAAKHFPGHTNYSVDTHKSLASFTVTEDEMAQSIQVFSTIIERAEPDIMMMAHVRYENYDSSYTASLSSYWIEEKLRDELGYNGVVITDDMTMKSVSKSYGIGDAAVQAVIAGNDIILYVSSPDMQNDAYLAVLNAVKNGTIPEERIDQSLNRILQLKVDKLGLQL